MTNINKLRNDVLELQNNKYHLEIREMLERLGVDEEKILSLDTDENIPKLMEAKELVEGIVQSQLFEKDENGRFNIEAKVTAITIMTASVGIMENFGVGRDATPYYSGVSRWLDVSIPTLRQWWKNQKAIMLEQGALGYAAVQRITLQQINLMEKYTKALDLDDEEVKALKGSPKGVAVILKIVTQLSLNVKMLNVQAEAISGVVNQVDTIEKGGQHGVTVLFPVETKKPKKRKDGNDITDRE